MVGYGQLNFLEFLERLKRNNLVHTLDPKEMILSSPFVELNAFSILPPIMMRAIQSNSILIEYLSLARNMSFVNPIEITTVRVHVSEYTIRTYENENINYFARHEFFRHADWLIRTYLDLVGKSEVRTMGR